MPAYRRGLSPPGRRVDEGRGPYQEHPADVEEVATQPPITYSRKPNLQPRQCAADDTVAGLHRRRNAAWRMVPLDCACRDPWPCRCTEPPLTENMIDAGRNAALHVLSTGHVPLLDLEAEYGAVEDGLRNHKRAMAFRAGSEIGSPPQPPQPGELVLGKQLSPLSFDTADLRMCHEAIMNRAPMQIRAKGGDFMGDVRTKTPGTFSSPVSLLPPQLWPQVVHPEHESRILDRLPATQIEAPSLEFVQHLSSTGSPAIVAEGATKPEISFVAQKVLAVAQKVACHIALTWESLTDPGPSGLQSWMGYVQGEIFKEVMDFENKQLISGTGGSTQIQGFLGGFPNLGILQHNAALDTGTGVTALDSFEIAIAAMRTGSALAEPNLVIMHPWTWSNLRRVKDGFYRFLVAPGPTQDETKTLWGMPVISTIAAPPGWAVMLDTTKYGFAVIREALTMRVGYDSGDFTANMQRIVVEERLTQAIVRPTAVMAVFNLPYVGGS
jgi:HK97 family phage major capsid protein